MNENTYTDWPEVGTIVRAIGGKLSGHPGILVKDTEREGEYVVIGMVWATRCTEISQIRPLTPEELERFEHQCEKFPSLETKMKSGVQNW